MTCNTLADRRNRNRIRTPARIQWFTIRADVKGKYTQRIRDTVIRDFGWARHHWRTLEHCYARAAGFGSVPGPIAVLYARAEQLSHAMWPRSGYDAVR